MSIARHGAEVFSLPDGSDASLRFRLDNGPGKRTLLEIQIEVADARACGVVGSMALPMREFHHESRLISKSAQKQKAWSFEYAYEIKGKTVWLTDKSAPKSLAAAVALVQEFPDLYRILLHTASGVEVAVVKPL